MGLLTSGSPERGYKMGKNWTMFLSDDMRTIEYMWLTDLTTNDDGSEKVYIYHLNKLFCSDDFMGARMLGRKAMEAIMNKTYDPNYCFSTPAFCRETTFFKKDYPCWWGPR